ncbi:hypothetical protein SDC9_190353 [bioreactor metagenome]|uniref:Uncharacterized protein n=1 Tax=bioreactor metagenome TaxID=1076179 RepID=A0A645HUR4_9ZZZZ
MTERLLGHHVVEFDERDRRDVAAVVPVCDIRSGYMLKMGFQDMLPAPDALSAGFRHRHRILVVVEENEIIHFIFKRCIEHGVSFRGVTAAEKKLRIGVVNNAHRFQKTDLALQNAAPDKMRSVDQIEKVAADIGVIRISCPRVLQVVGDQYIETDFNILGQPAFPPAVDIGVQDFLKAFPAGCKTDSYFNN